MDRCLTCNARVTGKTVCHRCGMPLITLIAAEQAAASLAETARRCSTQGNWQAALESACRAWALRHRPETARQIACAAVMRGDFSKALRFWRYVHRPPLK